VACSGGHVVMGLSALYAFASFQAGGAGPCALHVGAVGSAGCIGPHLHHVSAVKTITDKICALDSSVV